MKEITDKEFELFEKLKNIWFHSAAEKTGAFFICGKGGDTDSMGLPEHIFICPTYGLDGMAMYTKSKEYSAPEW